MGKIFNNLYKILILKRKTLDIFLSLFNKRVSRFFDTDYKYECNFIREAFEKEASDCIFVHAGLSRLKHIQDVKNPYSFLLLELKKYFKTILVPGFTPSFRHSGIYHVNFSIPEYGTWSKLFKNDATFRTMDAIHSILGLGEFDFSMCNHQDSFGKESCFYELIKKNVLIANIATDDFVCSLIHCLEKINNSTYIADDLVEGVIYKNNLEHFHIIQKNYKTIFSYYWNRKKILKDCKKEGIIRDYTKNGIILYFFNAGDFCNFISSKMKNDKYYLLKWGKLL